MSLSFFKSLRFRLIASVVVIEVIMLSVMVWSNVDSIYSTHSNRLNDTARSVLGQFASIAGSYIAEVDYAGLEEHAVHALKQGEVAYVIVLEADGRESIKLGKHFFDVTPEVDTHPTTVTDNVFDLAKEINLSGLNMGKVLMGFSLDVTNENIVSARNRSIFIASIEIVLSIIVTIILGVGLTRNLKSLATAAERVGAGHFDTNLPVGRNDEVGMTAQAFNKMVVDIADRTRRIEESQASISLLMDSTAEAIIGIDHNSLCVFVNQACLRMLGYDSVDQIVGKDFHELAHHHYPDGSVYPVEDCTLRNGALNDGIFHTNEEMFIRADGSFFPVESWIHPILRDGEREGCMVTFIDITERKKAEAEVSRLNKHFSLLLESTGEGIFGVDRELKCTFANRAAAKILGYSVDELLGQDMHTLVHYAYEDGACNPREKSLIYCSINENKTMRSEEEILWTKKGESFPAQYSASPITENGKVDGAAVVFRNVADARALAREMDYLATHDSLTGLFNRREFEMRLKHALEDTRMEGSEHILCYLDLDQFKVVNDTCGHVAGDELLRQLSGILHSMIRKHDTLARLGGDEFGLLLGHCNLHYALNLIEEVRHTISDFRFMWEEKTFSVGVSIGITEISTNTDSVGVALSEADAACYIAKDTGRNRIHIYEKADADIARRHGEMQWVSVISRALDQDRFALYGQTIMPTMIGNNSDLVLHNHFEVLLRLKDDNGNNLSPGAFIPAAERYGLMVKVDTWVINNTFKYLADNTYNLQEIGVCAINLSAHSINDENFLQMVCAKLEEWEIPGNKICFEITETAAVANLKQARHFIDTLKQKGCLFALDDFGSGMSSFAYLKNLPVDFLKIDGHFVRDIVDDDIDAAMVEAVNKVGQVMGIKTIAEFVENEKILEKLHDIGVDYVQGYAISKPCPLDKIFIRTSKVTPFPAKNK